MESMVSSCNVEDRSQLERHVVWSAVIRIQRRCQSLIAAPLEVGHHWSTSSDPLLQRSDSYFYLATVEPIQILGLFPWRRRRVLLKVLDSLWNWMAKRNEVEAHIYDPRVVEATKAELEYVAEELKDIKTTLGYWFEEDKNRA